MVFVTIRSSVPDVTLFRNHYHNALLYQARYIQVGGKSAAAGRLVQPELWYWQRNIKTSDAELMLQITARCKKFGALPDLSVILCKIKPPKLDDFC